MVEKFSGELTDEVQLSAANGAEGNGEPSDEYDLESLRLKQDFDEIVGAQAVLATVAVRKPGAQEWFRVHPDSSWRLETTLLQLKEDRESYLVAPSLRAELWDEILPIVLYTAVSRQGEPFLWPVRLPKSDGKTDKYMETDLAAALEIARLQIEEMKEHVTKAKEVNNIDAAVNLAATAKRLLGLVEEGERVRAKA